MTIALLAALMGSVGCFALGVLFGYLLGRRRIAPEPRGPIDRPSGAGPQLEQMRQAWERGQAKGNSYTPPSSIE